MKTLPAKKGGRQYYCRLHACKKIVWKDFEIKIVGKYHDLYVQRDTSLLADVFEKFRNICFKVYKLDPVHFVFTPGLVW